MKRLARLYFAAQTLAGAVWWILVFAVSPVRELTLGALDPVIVAAFDVPLFVLASAAAALGVRASAEVATVWTAIVTVGLALYATLTQEAGWGAVAMIAAFAGSTVATVILRIGRIPTELVISGPFRFAPAPRRRTAGNLGRTLLQMVVFWGFFLGLLPWLIATVEARWRVGATFPAFLVPAGWALLFAASALGVWSAVVMATRGSGTPLPSSMAHNLVVLGPYRWVRNPMAVAGIAQGIGIGLIAGSWMVIVYALAGSLVWNYAVRPHEERDLSLRFGTAYDHYRSRVACWVPRLPVGDTGE